MANRFVYADEAGCFTFNNKPNVSKYFIIVTIRMSDWEKPTLGLQRLRHELILDGLEVGDYFHATTDTQAVRDRVFENILNYEFKVQATICEKAKAQPSISKSKSRFYKVPWFFHVKNSIAPFLEEGDDLIVTAASLGTKKEKAVFVNELDDVMKQTIKRGNWTVDFRSCQTDPCMQIADYCAWAIQRKWELQDERSFQIIKDRITREYDLWRHGHKLYY